MKKIGIIIIAALLLIGACVGGGAVIKANTPEVTAIRSIDGFFDDLLERREVEPLVNMLKEGSFGFTVKDFKGYEGNSDKNPVDLLDDSELSGKIYFGADSLTVKDLILKHGGKENLSLDLWLTENELVLSEESVLGGSYGVEFENIVSELKDSIFAYNSESEYSFSEFMTEDEWDALIEALEASDKKTVEKMTGDLADILEDYVREFYDIVTEYAEFDSEKKNVRLYGEKKKVRVITVTIDAENMADIVSDFYDFVLGDTRIEEFLDEYEENILSALIAADEVDEDDDLSLAEMYADWLDEIEADVFNFCKEMRSENFYKPFEEWKLELVTPTMSSKLLKLTLKLDGRSQFMLNVGHDGIKKSDKITLEVDDTEMVYEISNNSKNAYVSALEINGEKMFDISVNLSKGKYKVSLDDRAFAGEIKTEKNTTTVTIDKIVMYDEDGEIASYITTGIKIVISESDKAPAVPKDYTTIDKIKEKDIEEWIEKIAELGE